METSNYVQGIVPDLLPNGISMVPLRRTTRLGKVVVEKYFLSGFLGISQDCKTMAIRPEIAWAVVGWPPTKEEKKAAWHDASNQKQAVKDIKDIKEQLRFLMRVWDHKK